MINPINLLLVHPKEQAGLVSSCIETIVNLQIKNTYIHEIIDLINDDLKVLKGNPDLHLIDDIVKQHVLRNELLFQLKELILSRNYNPSQIDAYNLIWPLIKGIADTSVYFGYQGESEVYDALFITLDSPEHQKSMFLLGADETYCKLRKSHDQFIQNYEESVKKSEELFELTERLNTHFSKLMSTLNTLGTNQPDEYAEVIERINKVFKLSLKTQVNGYPSVGNTVLYTE